MRVEQVSSLITQKVEMMAKAEDLGKLCSKYRAVCTLLPYAVQQERDGQPEMLNTFLHAARASGILWFRWERVSQFASVIFSKATPHAITLISLYMFQDLLSDEDLAQMWAAATSTVQYSEEVAQSVVDTLLRLAYQPEGIQPITVNIWRSWVTKQPALPPICLGRYCGSNSHIVKAVRGLKDIEVLKSYLLITWSEWDTFDSVDEICASIDEDFGGVGMGPHRADLIQRLDYILSQLDRGVGYLSQHNPSVGENRVQAMKRQYQRLREASLETNLKTIIRVFDSIIVPVHILTGQKLIGSHVIFMCAVPLLCP